MVKVGEVEFLVKFDGINTEFKKTLVAALKEAGLGDGGKDDTPDDIKKQVTEINNRLRRMFVNTGKMDSFGQFVQKSENIVRYLSDKDNLEDIAESVLSSEATRKYLGVTDEMMKDYTGKALPKAITKLDEVSKHLIKTIDESVKNSAIWEKNKAMFGQILPMFEQVKQGNNIANFVKTIVRRTMKESTAVVAGLVDLAIGHKLKFQAARAAGGQEEKVWRLAKFGFGKGDEDIGSPTEFIGAFLKEGMDKLTDEEMKDIILYGKTPTTSDRMGVLNDVIETIINTYSILSDTPIPSSISGLFEKKSEQLGGGPEQIFFKEWDEFTKEMQKTDPNYMQTAGERLSVKFDFILEGLADKMDLFEEDIENLTGKGGVFDDAREQMERFDLENFYPIIEAKLDKAIANFDWNIATVKAFGTAVAKDVFSGILNIEDIDTEGILKDLQKSIKELPFELMKEIVGAFYKLGLSKEEIAKRMRIEVDELMQQYGSVFKEEL